MHRSIPLRDARGKREVRDLLMVTDEWEKPCPRDRPTFTRRAQKGAEKAKGIIVSIIVCLGVVDSP
jgi:hypothetical protein